MRILITARAFSQTGPEAELLRQAGCELIFPAPAESLSSAELALYLQGIDGLILGLEDCTAAVMAQADKLKVISRFGVGFDNVDVAAASAKAIVVTRAVGGNASAVAELALGFMFALARNLLLSASAAKQAQWLRPRGWELSSKTLGIIGLGIIGRLLAEKALALGMKVLAFDPYAEAIPGVKKLELDELLKTADIVSLHCALNSETRNILSRERLAQMKAGSYLINTARGALVDEVALYEFLKEGRLAGAAMDAFATEPPKDNPLLELDSFIATPHIGANTHEAAHKVAMLAAQNVLDILWGKACPNIVNPEIYKEQP